jgi:enoyl-CoA hydratase
MAMLLAGRALRDGLLFKVVEPTELLDASHALADRMMRGSEMSLPLTKLALLAEPGAHPALDDVAQAVLFHEPERAPRIHQQLDRQS